MTRASEPNPPRFRCVVFDCDSTLAAIEGIDELAGEHADEVRRMTDAAMDGSVPLDEVYGRRLDLIRPRREAVEALGAAYVEALVPGARETISTLLGLGVDVRVVSGGLRPPVEAVAAELGIATSAVQAVGIRFSRDGEYLDFERDHPLARSGGKLEVLRTWKLPRPALMVGDGTTDLEARPAVDCFAAFTGVVHRRAVVEAADLVIEGPSLIGVLDVFRGADE